MRRLKVFHLITHAGRHPYLCHLVDYADRDRFEIAVGVLESDGPLLEDLRTRGVRTLALDCHRRAQYPGTAVRLAAWLGRERTDVVQTHLLEASLVGLVAARLAGTSLVILTGHHSREVQLYANRRLFWADCLCSRWLAHRIIAPSADMAETFIRRERVPRRRVAVVPNGFSLDAWRVPPGRRERVRAELGLEGKTVFGTVGRLYWVKNHADLLDAFAPLAAARPDLALLLVGDGPAREELARRAERLAIRPQVVFAGHRPDVADMLGAMDILVHASLAESFGNVILEALAAGLPVVSTAVGIVPEVLRDGVNGLVVPVRQPDCLRRALETMLARRADWPAMGEQARRAAAAFPAEKMAAGYEACYTRWLAELKQSPDRKGGVGAHPSLTVGALPGRC
jgi:glycosyltransferase involved in cell wall biosynthesis